MSSPLRDGVRNDLIESLADSEYALARNLAAYREMLHVSLTLLHERGAALDRVRSDNRQLRDECRRLGQGIAQRDQPRAAA